MMTRFFLGFFTIMGLALVVATPPEIRERMVAQVIGASSAATSESVQAEEKQRAEQAEAERKKVEESQKKAEPHVSFAILGDVMLARGVAEKNKNNWGEVCAGLPKDIFAGTHAVVANLEGVFMDKPAKLPKNTMTFQFETDAITGLLGCGITHVSLANNHSDNGGKAGTAYTHALLDTASIQWFGGYDAASPAKVGVLKGEGMDVVIIGVNLTYAPNDITKLIKLYTEDFGKQVVIFPHWGEEYADSASSAQRLLAYSWVDAGASLVVGTHTHSVQDMEVYKGVPIIYSLGNAIFDQSWSQETSEGAVLHVVVKEDRVELRATPVEIKDARPVTAGDAARLNVFERLGYQLVDTQPTVFKK